MDVNANSTEPVISIDYDNDMRNISIIHDPGKDSQHQKRPTQLENQF